MLIDIISKIPHVDVNYFSGVLGKYKENEWVYPFGADYHVFSDLYEFNCVCRMSVPKYNNGSFRGYAVAFKYNFNLSYGDN